jgi:hypothetical protein
MATALAETGLAVHNLSARVTGRLPGYEFAVAPSSRWSPAEVERVTRRLDAALGAVAPGYLRARERGALAGPRLRLVPATAFQRDWHARVAEGTRPAQVKDRLFRKDGAEWDRLVDPPAHSEE